MNMPFAYFADQQFLGTTLQVRSETPIYPRLVQDGVAEKVDPLLNAPRIGFRHPEVGRLFQVHQAAAKLFLPRLRPLLFRQEIVSRYPDLDTFPLDLLRRITTVFEASPEADPRSVLPRIGAWIREQLGSDWEGMLAGLEVDEKQRQEMDQFFDKLGALAGNVIV